MWLVTLIYVSPLAGAALAVGCTVAEQPWTRRGIR